VGNNSCGCQSRATVAGGKKHQISTDPGRTGTVIYINSAVLGRGSDELGTNLLGVYLDTLSNFARDLSHIVLINGGVKLACRGSASVEQLENLAGIGIKILSCGTCLNHFALKDDLVVGEISNMVEIQETLLSCGKILTP